MPVLVFYLVFGTLLIIELLCDESDCVDSMLFMWKIIIFLDKILFGKLYAFEEK